jgi:hypothetical protein
MYKKVTFWKKKNIFGLEKKVIFEKLLFDNELFLSDIIYKYKLYNIIFFNVDFKYIFEKKD